MNAFLESFVCEANDKGTKYFWFEAFDEPWKIRFNEPGREFEDKWVSLVATLPIAPLNYC